jgi:hypothetical protein
MRAEELDNLTEKELLASANGCFARAETTVLYLKPSPEERVRLLLEAQFYLTAVARKRDDRVARRDFWMEVAVIILIGLEIVLSLAALREGAQQSKVLDHMDQSAAATASAMKLATASLQTLADDQGKSLARLNDMNNSLQASLSRTGTMASTTRKQLEVLQKEQADRQAQLAKKPKLALYIGAVPANTALTVNLPVREQTDTTITLDLNLTNEGDATANQVALRAVVAAKDVALQASLYTERTVEPADSTQHTFIIQVAPLHARVTVPMTATFTFPKGQPKFKVTFSIDANEIETGTPLGTIELAPRKPTS